MINANFIKRCGAQYSFTLASATTGYEGTAVFDRPIKRFKIVTAGVNIVTDIDELDSYGYEFPCIYGYPQIFNLSSESAEVVIEVLEYGDKANVKYFDAYDPIQFTVKAKGGTATVLGKRVSTLQTSVTVDNIASNLTGTLHYVSDFEGYSTDPALQKGYFLALAVDSSETGVTYIARLMDAESTRFVTLDSDKDIVIRVTNPKAELTFLATKSNRPLTSKSFTFEKLIKEVAE